MGHQHFDSLDLLQARSAQVRALALCLVRDAATADDLVQDALTRALRRPASVTGDWRAWIGVTLRNLVRDSAREASRRETRERRAAEATRDATALHADAESTVERAELQRLVVDEVLALDELHRTVILLHDLDGLGLAEVARRLGITPEVAKKRRQRALVLLRGKLESRLGPDGRWAVALLPMCGARELQGLSSSATHTTLLVAATVAVIGGVLALRGLLSNAKPDEQEPLVHAPAGAPRVDDSLEVPDAPFTRSSPDEQDSVGAVEAPASVVASVHAPRLDPSVTSPSPELLPELVWIPAGTACIGSTDHEILMLLAEWPMFPRVLDAQRPQHRVDLPGFFLSRTEVTNAHYLAFVVATNRRPPLRWADREAATRAATEFAENEERTRIKMHSIGIAYKKRKWDSMDPDSMDPYTGTPRDAWWSAHWRETPWSIPTGEETLPVVCVTYSDAVAYCTWAGGRLPSEFEFQRAARGAEARAYPYGVTFDSECTVSAEQKRRTPAPVGSHPRGASPFGILDLAGNVWEWTASSYTPYPGHEPRDYTVVVEGVAQRKTPEHLWDVDQQVVVGGGFQEDRLAARVATRRGADRTQLTDALGFRLARSGPPE